MTSVARTFCIYPTPQGGGRDGDGRWKYRIGLQANLFIGALNRMSIVPPCLKTGGELRHHLAAECPEAHAGVGQARIHDSMIMSLLRHKNKNKQLILFVRVLVLTSITRC